MIFKYEKLKEARKMLRLNLDEFAQLLGVSRRTMWSWEKGHITPNERKIRMIAKSLNLPVSEISSIPEKLLIKEENEIRHNLREAWFSLLEDDEVQREAFFDNFAGKLKSVNKTITNSSIIIKALMNSIDIAFYIKDIQNRFILVNSSFKTLFNIHDDFIIQGKTDINLFSKKFSGVNTREDESVLNNETVIKNIEKKMSNKDVWVRVSKLPVFDKLKNIIGIIGVFNDITEMKNAEMRRNILEKSIDLIEDSVVIVDTKNENCLYINSNSEKISGHTPEEFQKKGRSLWLQYVHSEDLKEQEFYSNNSNQCPSRREYRIIMPDNSIKWCETIRSPIKYNKKELFIAVSRDITKKRQEEYYRIMLELTLNNSSDVVWLVNFNIQSKYLFISDSVENIYGYKKQYFLEDNLFWLNKCVHTVNLKNESEYLRNKNWPQKRFIKIIKSNGDERIIEQTCVKKEYYDECYYAFVGRDIT